MVTFVDPRGVPATETVPYDLADPLADGTVIALMANGFPDSDTFLDCVADPGALDPADASEMGNRRALMLKAIQQLSERQRVVLSLYYFEDLNLKEIGAILGVTESRISQIHSKAVQQLRPILEDLFYDE